MSPAENARRLARGIPGAELHLVDGAGHAVPLDQPEASARLLVDWMTRHADAAPPQATGSDVTRERLTRPWSLPTGALRNTRDAVLCVPALRRRG